MPFLLLPRKFSSLAGLSKRHVLFDGMLSTDFFYAHIYLFPKLNEYIKECLVNHENKENICPTIVAALHLDETRVHARHLLSNKTYYFGPK